MKKLFVVMMVVTIAVIIFISGGVVFGGKKTVTDEMNKIVTRVVDGRIIEEHILSNGLSFEFLD